MAAAAKFIPDTSTRKDGRTIGGRNEMAITSVARKSKKRKKDAQLVLRLNHELRDRFIDACDDLDTSAAREVRRFMKRFLKKYERGDFDE